MSNPKTIDEEQIKSTAKAIRESMGGTILAFPVEADNPFSEYAVVVYREGTYFVYPQAESLSVAAAGVVEVLDLLTKEGLATSYKNDVRFISYQAQVDAPDVTMRRLKKRGYLENNEMPYQSDVDIREGEGEEPEETVFLPRGVLKVAYLSMVDNNTPKAALFMDKYYELLAMRRYGKTAGKIKREVRRMSKDEAIKWLEQTYDQFITDPMDLIGIFNSIAEKK